MRLRLHSAVPCRLLLPLAAVALLAGCTTPDPAYQGPFFAPINHAGEPSLGGLRRVVLLPVAGGEIMPLESAATLDPVLVAALQRENRFEVVSLSRAECLRRFRTTEFVSTSALPPGLLPALRDDFGAEAVLFIDVTVFSAYRPLALGLRGKLATIDGRRLVWTFDTVFSAEDPAVVNAARRHVLNSDGAGLPADLTGSVLQSPARFAGYAAAAMFATLPPVRPAAALATSAEPAAHVAPAIPAGVSGAGRGDVPDAGTDSALKSSESDPIIDL